MRRDTESNVDFSLEYPRYSLSEEERLEELRKVAYELYEKKGKAPGTEFVSWLEAAQIIKSRR